MRKKCLLSSRSRAQWGLNLYNENMTVSTMSSNLLFVCNQTWSDGTSSWARVPCEKIWLLFSRSRSQWWLILSNCDCLYCIFWTANYPWYFFVSGSVVEKKKSCFKAKLQSISYCPASIFWTTELFITTLGMLVHHYEPEYHVKKLVCCLHAQGHNECSYNGNMTS